MGNDVLTNYAFIVGNGLYFYYMVIIVLLTTDRLLNVYCHATYVSRWSRQYTHLSAFMTFIFCAFCTFLLLFTQETFIASLQLVSLYIYPCIDLSLFVFMTVSYGYMISKIVSQGKTISVMNSNDGTANRGVSNQHQQQKKRRVVILKITNSFEKKMERNSSVISHCKFVIPAHQQQQNQQEQQEQQEQQPQQPQPQQQQHIHEQHCQEVTNNMASYKNQKKSLVVPFLLVLTFVIFLIIPDQVHFWTHIRKETLSYNTLLFFSVIFPLSPIVDALIYIFLKKSSRVFLKNFFSRQKNEAE